MHALNEFLASHTSASPVLRLGICFNVHGGGGLTPDLTAF